MKTCPLVLQNKRPEEFYGPEDWTGGDPADDIAWILKEQVKWDEAYESLSFWERFRYDIFGYWS